MAKIRYTCKEVGKGRRIEVGSMGERKRSPAKTNGMKGVS